jgi:hypothetical protein
MAGRSDQVRELLIEAGGEPVSLPLPTTVVKVLWHRGGETPEGALYANPLVVRLGIDGDANGNVVVNRIEAFGALASIGPLPGLGSAVVELFIESPGGPDWMNFQRAERPLSADDTRLLSTVTNGDNLGVAIANYAAYTVRRRHALSVAETRAVQRHAGSRRAASTDEDLRLVAETVRNRAQGVTPAAAVMRMPDRRIGRSYAYQLIKRAKAEGYLSESEA